MLVCYILAGSLALLVLLYICFELNYFLRLILCVLSARLFKKRVHILQETQITGKHFFSILIPVSKKYLFSLLKQFISRYLCNERCGRIIISYE